MLSTEKEGTPEEEEGRGHRDCKREGNRSVRKGETGRGKETGVDRGGKGETGRGKETGVDRGGKGETGRGKETGVDRGGKKADL